MDTVKGTITAEGTAQALTITLPEGVTAQVRLPGMSEVTIAQAGTTTVRSVE